MNKPWLIAVLVAIACGAFVLGSTGCAPMSSTARFAATWRMHLDLALVHDRDRIRTDLAHEQRDLPAATAAYIRHLRRGEQQRVLGTDTVRQLLDEMATELHRACDVCTRMLERERAGLDTDL